MKDLMLGLLFLGTGLPAQPPIQWAKAFGGTNADEAYEIQQTFDGGYIVAGPSNSNNGNVFGNHGGVDFWVLKIDSLGAIQWKKNYGGSNDEQVYSVEQTFDGGYVLTGYTLSSDEDVSGNHGFYDAWVLKLSGTGAIQWQKCLGGTGWDDMNEVHQTTDGGYILAGRSRSTDGDVTGNHGGSDYWIVKLDSTGTMEWQKSHGGSYEDLAYSIKQTSDGGYIVGGESSSNDGNVTVNHGNPDYWIVKLNYEGKIEWQKSLGGSSLDRANDILQSRDGGYIAFGQSYSNNGDVTGNHGNNDFWVVKLSEMGDIEWQKSLGGSSEEYARSICQTKDGGYIMVGQTQSNNGDVVGNDGGADIWVVKLSEEGNLLWQKTLGGTMAEWGNSIQQTNDEGYILAGFAWSNNGDVSGVHGANDFWVVKLSPESTPTTEAPSHQISIYPNPAQESITLNLPSKESTVTVSISDLLGQEVGRRILVNSEQVDVSGLGQGFYVLTATTVSGQVYSGKFWKE